jgi:hypothetical protein
MDGTAARYSPGLMERVAARRGMATNGCLISSAYYPIGTELWVFGRNTRALRLCTVVDVSHPRDMARHRRTKRLIEIAHEDAMSICGSVKSRPIDCPVIVFYTGGS